jgi:hypothetical protein
MEEVMDNFYIHADGIKKGQCEYSVSNDIGVNFHQCDRNATIEQGGHGFCKTHARKLGIDVGDKRVMVYAVFESGGESNIVKTKAIVGKTARVKRLREFGYSATLEIGKDCFLTPLAALTYYVTQRTKTVKNIRENLKEAERYLRTATDILGVWKDEHEKYIVEAQ